MNGDNTGVEARALTREGYLRLMETRTRPLEQPYMSNERATVFRSEQVMADASPLDTVLDDLEDKARRKKLIKRLRGLREPDADATCIYYKPESGNGYKAHRYHGEVPCDDCKRARRDYYRNYYGRAS